VTRFKYSVAFVLSTFSLIWGGKGIIRSICWRWWKLVKRASLGMLLERMFRIFNMLVYPPKVMAQWYKPCLVPQSLGFKPISEWGWKSCHVLWNWVYYYVSPTKKRKLVNLHLHMTMVSILPLAMGWWTFSCRD
jgi:hypothetical protein